MPTYDTLLTLKSEIRNLFYREVTVKPNESLGNHSLEVDKKSARALDAKGMRMSLRFNY